MMIPLSEWPRDPASNLLLCAPAHPMPKGEEHQQWAHTGAYCTGSNSSDTAAYFACRDCGTTWAEELPG